MHTPNKYDANLPHQQSNHSQHVTIGYLKKTRLEVLNERRAKNGLPPTRYGLPPKQTT